jgi:hypothetical protein
MGSWRVGTVALLLAATVGFTTGVLIEKKAGGALLNRDLANAFGLLENDLDSLQRYSAENFTTLHEDPANKALVPLTGELASIATRDELDARLRGIRLKIFQDIQSQSISGQSSEVWSHEAPIYLTNGQSFDWIIPDGIKPVGISIRNPGPATITDLEVYLNGKKKPGSIEEILETATSDASSDEETAVALWRFVSQNRIHDWPPHSGEEAFDPVKLMSVYGYGFCSHAAKALAILANQAGLESRIRHAKGQHVICEILIDGRWAMFDPDGEVFYRFDDGRIASVDEISKNPEIILTARSPLYSFSKLQDIFSNHHLITIPFEKFGNFTPHRIFPALRPGEEMVFSRQKRGLFFASRYLEVPREYANGLWVFEPVWWPGEKLPAGVVLSNLMVVDSDKSGRLRIANPELAAGLTCFFDLPYPAMKTTLEMMLQPNDTSKKLKAMISRDGKFWMPSEQSVEDGKIIHRFKEFPNRLGGQPDYKFWLKIVTSPSEGLEEFPKFRTAIEMQMAPRALPIPEASRATIAFVYESKKDQKIEIGLINEIPSSETSRFFIGD